MNKAEQAEHLHSMLTMSNISHKEWLEASIQEGLIYCCPENDIELDFPYIALGAYGVVCKATISDGITTTIRHNIFPGMTVAVKILISDKHGACEDLHNELVKEVAITFPLCLLHTFTFRVD